MSFPRSSVCDSLFLLIRWDIAMGRAYSQDLRERVIAPFESGMGAYELNVSQSIHSLNQPEIPLSNLLSAAKS